MREALKFNPIVIAESGYEEALELANRGGYIAVFQDDKSL